MKKKVAIFGGGISGLTVAHECIEAGFEVHLYEKKEFFGGKAQGFRDDRGFPIEHATRIILCNYQSFLETLKRVPAEEGQTLFDHLVPVKGIIFSYHKNHSFIPLYHSVGLRKRLAGLFKNQKAWNLSWKESARLFFMIVSYLCKCEKRKENTLRTTSFAQYHQFEKASPQFRNYLETLFNQFITARSHSLSIILDDLLWKLFDFNDNPYQMESLGSITNGPTNESLLDPWVKHLAKLGVHFHLQSPLESLSIEKNLVQKAFVKGKEPLQADAFVLAVPYHELQALAPDLGLPQTINLEWSMGFQIFLNHIPDFIFKERAFVNVQDSPWKIVYLLQHPDLWPKVELPPNIQAVLSGIVTCIHHPGVIYPRFTFQCRPEEVKAEILAQLDLKDHPAVSGFLIDPQLRFLHSSEVAQNPEYRDWLKGPLFEDGYQWVLEAPLFIEKPLEIKEPIYAKTKIQNLYLAGEHLKTTFLIPTMERANESGKLCAEQIYKQFGLSYPQQRYMRKPLPLGWIRKIDSFIYSIQQLLSRRNANF